MDFKSYLLFWGMSVVDGLQTDASTSSHSTRIPNTDFVGCTKNRSHFISLNKRNKNNNIHV